MTPNDDFFSDEVYIFTLLATGCPNGNPSLGWWKNLTKEYVFSDMNTYCEMTRDGNADEDQKRQCCGNTDCTVNNCTRQTTWATGN